MFKAVDFCSANASSSSVGIYISHCWRKGRAFGQNCCCSPVDCQFTWKHIHTLVNEVCMMLKGLKFLINACSNGSFISNSSTDLVQTLEAWHRLRSKCRPVWYQYYVRDCQRCITAVSCQNCCRAYNVQSGLATGIVWGTSCKIGDTDLTRWPRGAC